MRIVVTGGRNFANSPRLFEALDAFHAQRPVVALAQGGATGADRYAGWWAKEQGIPVKTYPADWAKFGRAAGMIRNKAMLYDFRPDAVIAFPGGKGTAHCVATAHNLGIRVLEIGPGGPLPVLEDPL